MAEHEMEPMREVCAKCDRTRVDIEDDPRPCGEDWFSIAFVPATAVVAVSNTHTFHVTAADEAAARMALQKSWPNARVMWVKAGKTDVTGHRPLKAPGD